MDKTQLTEEELVFAINVLAEINVSVKNAQAQQVIAQAQTVINKLRKMVDELKGVEQKVE